MIFLYRIALCLHDFDLIFFWEYLSLFSLLLSYTFGNRIFLKPIPTTPPPPPPPPPSSLTMLKMEVWFISLAVSNSVLWRAKKRIIIFFRLSCSNSNCFWFSSDDSIRLCTQEQNLRNITSMNVLDLLFVGL